jgi:hypothetical protein
MVGEKWTRIDMFGDCATTGHTQDCSVYNGDHLSHYSRRAGPTRPLLGGNPLQGGTGDRFGSAHPGVCQFVMGDGSVRAIRITIDDINLGRLANRMDDMPISYVD